MALFAHIRHHRRLEFRYAVAQKITTRTFWTLTAREGRQGYDYQAGSLSGRRQEPQVTAKLDDAMGQESEERCSLDKQ